MAQAAPQQELRYLVRIANTDLKGDRALGIGLTQIRGISHMFSHMVCSFAGLDATMKTGSLSDEQVKKIEEVISHPLKHGAPSWMLNRRKDIETGADMHLLGGDLKFAQENDIKLLKKIKSWRGFRHGQGLPCRGQRTRSNFRKSKSRGKGGLGVTRAKAAPAAKPAATPAAPAKGGK